MIRQATQEQGQDCEGDGEGKGGDEGQEEVEECWKWISCLRLAFFGGLESGRGCLCVPTRRSRIVWRVGDSRASTSYSSDDRGMQSLIDVRIGIHKSIWGADIQLTNIIERGICLSSQLPGPPI